MLIPRCEPGKDEAELPNCLKCEARQDKGGSVREIIARHFIIFSSSRNLADEECLEFLFWFLIFIWKLWVGYSQASLLVAGACLL
jgi:hypothetical protein